MENKKTYIKLDSLEIYNLSRELCRVCWKIYNTMDREAKRLVGEQFVRSIDSVSANIAEGYGRFHYLDKIKFMYNSRGSLLESKHWLEIIAERFKLNQRLQEQYNELWILLEPKLNAFIASIYRTKNQKE